MIYKTVIVVMRLSCITALMSSITSGQLMPTGWTFSAWTCACIALFFLLYVLFLFWCDRAKLLSPFHVEQSIVNFVKYLLGVAGETGFGSRSTADDVCQRYATRIRGRKIVITGWTSGIGFECARALAAKGAHLILLGRDAEKAKFCETKLRALCPSIACETFTCELSDLNSVRLAAAQVATRHTSLYALINNGGIASCPATMTACGTMELQFATNVAGPFLLTELLLPLLAREATATEPSRVVNVASKAHKLFKGWDNSIEGMVTSTATYSALGSKEYAFSKLCNILHAVELNRRCGYQGLHVAAFSLHPGGVSTGITRHVFAPWVQTLLLGVLFRPFVKTIPQGAATQALLAVAPVVELTPGAYYQDCNCIAPSPVARDERLARRVWALLVRLTSESGKKVE